MSKKIEHKQAKQEWLAQRLRNSKKNPSSSGLSQQPRPTHLPLSFAQQRLWFLDQWEPGSSAYLLSFAWRVHGPLHVPTLESSFTALVARHESLRTKVSFIDGAPVQTIETIRPVSFPFHDLTILPEAAKETELQRLIHKESNQPFDLSIGPLWRFQLLGLGVEDHALLLTLHHIITDGWSMGVFFNEWTMLYNSQLAGQAIELTPLPLQYADYAIWQRQWLQGKELDRHLHYWKTQLTGAPSSIDLPTDFPRPAQQTYQGTRLTFSLPQDLVQRLQMLSRQEGMTLFMTMLATFQLLLFRYTGQEDLSLGTPIAGRTQTNLEGLIGFFVNTLVLRSRLKGHLTFQQFLHQVRETCLEAYAHQDLPFEKLVEILQPVRDASRHPLFQVMFQLHQADLAKEFTLSQVQVQPIQKTIQSSKFDLSIELVQRNEKVDGTIVFNSGLFLISTIQQFAIHYQQLLEGVTNNIHQAINAIPLLPDAERQQLLVEWNDTKKDYAVSNGAHQLFEEQVVRTPEAIALTFEERQVTYQELNRRANQLAHFLRTRGVGPEVRVGLCLERGIDMLISVLGVLKAGGAYVPLDPNYPEERQHYIVTHSQPQCVLTQPSFASWLANTTATRIDLDPDGLCYAAYSIENPSIVHSKLNLAYVIYTSGSTGKPKGVMVTHQSLCNLLCTLQERIEVSPTSTMLAVTSLSFDISVFELLGPLIAGARLVMTSHEIVSDGIALHAILLSESITLMQATPSTWSMLIQSGSASSTRPLDILCGGEALSLDLADQLTSWGASAWNIYGPTETTIWSTICRLEASNKTISIGRPLANTSVYLVDQAQELVPRGLTGALLIGGDGLARGYHDRPDLTAEKFIPNPFGTVAEGRLYRTGDIVKYRPDGALDFLGREDHQVKLRGFRIECGEIEAALTTHPTVQKAIVVCREDNSGEKMLVAYVVPTGTVQPTRADINMWLKRTLPDYMIPAGFVSLSVLPLTPNGKVDRKALPPPDYAHQVERTTYVPPRTPTEKLIADIWRELLNRDQVSIHDNFFELGGHSLLAAKIVARLRPILSNDLTIRTFFNQPTIAELSAALQPSESTPTQPTAPPLHPQAHEGPPPLSFAQQRLWFLNQWEPESTAYLLPFAWNLTGPLNISALEASLTVLAAEQDSLRTSIDLVHDQPVQIISSPTPVSLAIHDLTSLSTALCKERIQSSVHQEQQRPFDLTNGPLWRCQILRLAPEEHILLLTFHHIITDAWSMGLFFQALQNHYAATITGQASSLLSQPIQYADFAIWQRQWLQGDELDRQLTYWRTALADTSTHLDLPTDYQRPPQVSYQGKQISFSLPAPLTQALNKLSRQEGVTLFMTLLAAFQLLLFRYTSQRDILVGTPIAGRTHTEVEGLIGFFVNTLVLRTSFIGQETFKTLVRRVRETCLEAYAHQDLPFEKLVEALQPVRDISRHPLFQVVFQLHQADLMSELCLPQVKVQPLKGSNQTAKFDLSLELVEHDETLNGTFIFNTDLFDGETISRLATHYQTLLEALTQHPTKVVNHFPLLSKIEEQQLLNEWNSQISPEQPTLCVHHLFEDQVTRTPEAVAIIEEDQHVTYATLDQRANQLAQFLQIQGVGPEARVGLYLERGMNLVVVMLGILKAGGAYVPLDSGTPTNRLHFMLEDANVALVLTSTALKEQFIATRRFCKPSRYQEYQTIAVDEMWQDLSCLDTPDKQKSLTEENLAYVMYTSGSTGQPKGVGIPHRGVVRLIQDPTFLSWPDQVNCFQLASPAFDAATFEIWGCFAKGGTLVMAPPQMPSFDELGDLLCRHQITILWLTAGLFRQLIDWNIQALRNLKILLAGGDVLSPEHVQRMTAELPDCTLINGYGPTENTTFTCCFSISEHKDLGQSVPIGRPIPQTQVYVLDAQQNLLPRGVSGELCTSGRGLGRGYYQQPELTAEKFIPHPYSTEPGERLYRSGDIVKHLSNGDLQFIGRRDHQVKIRGYRIECGEIESVLARHPAVKDAVIQSRYDEMGYKRLVAYIIPANNVVPNISEFRDFLSLRLPSYMIPSHYISLDAFPLTANGKIDLQKLPFEDQVSAQAEGASVVPRNTLETQLTRIWEAVLGKQPIGVTDNFFNLGGESLMAVRLCSEIERTLQQKVPVSLIFQTQTIDQLAKKLTQPRDQGASPLMIPIQSSGSNPPIFGVLFGATFKPFMNNYPNQPYYMFFNQGHDGNPAIHATVEQIASWYLKEMRTIQARGPYYLAGYSFGGMVAFEMAQQLRQQGETIALLALVDPTLPSSQEKHVSKNVQLETLSVKTFKKEDQQAHTDVTSPHSSVTDLSTRLQLRVTNVKTRSTSIMKSIFCRTFFRIGYPLPPSLRPWYRNQVVQEAAKLYIPQKYPEQITLFKSSNYGETLWRTLCPKIIEAKTFPTEHLDLVDGSHTETLLHEIMTHLKKAQETSKAN